TRSLASGSTLSCQYDGTERDNDSAADPTAERLIPRRFETSSLRNTRIRVTRRGVCRSDDERDGGASTINLSVSREGDLRCGRNLVTRVGFHEQRDGEDECSYRDGGPADDLRPSPLPGSGRRFLALSRWRRRAHWHANT